MKLYLHIGVEKTGTSSIQSFMYDNRKVLKEEYNLLYPETGLWHDKSHHELSFAVINSNLHTDKPENMDALFSKLELEIKESKCTSVLLSSEILRGLHETKYLDIFMHKIKTIFDEIELIVFLRDQPYWLISMYNQYVKDPNIKYKNGFEDFYITMKDKADFYTMLQQWNLHIKNENIHVFPYYEKNNKEKKSSIAVMSDFLNLDTNDFIFNKNKNISLNRIQIDFFKFFNRSNIDQEKRFKINKLILNNFNNEDFDYLMSKYSVTTIKNKIDIHTYYKENNKKISKEFMNKEKDLFPEISEDVDSIDLNALTPMNFQQLLLSSVREGNK